MSFKKFTDEQIIGMTTETISIETGATTNVVRHFREIFDRKLHLKRGYSSMFLMATKFFGYDKASAQRRVKAMELSITVPDVLEKIDAGAMCLQSAADIQTFLDLERGAKRPYSAEEKRALVESCSGLSTRKVEIELASRNPTLDFKESKKFVSRDRLRVTHTIAVSTEEKLDRIKQLRSHVNPYMTREELLDYMAEVTLDAIDPARKDERIRKRAEVRARKIEVSAPEPTSEVSAPEPTLEIEEEILGETGEVQLVAKFGKGSRYISAAEDRKARMNNEGRGCDFVDPETGNRCGSFHQLHQLQRDHVIEYSQGGSNGHENLQMHCAQHNRFRWRRRLTTTVNEPVRRYA
ncbi:MAG: HNH endonuclease [Bdellovibrionota bacterium]